MIANDASKPEPSPITTEQSQPVVPHTIGLLKGINRKFLADDLLARAKAGESHYGTPLMSHNGRNALVDLYQELLDALNYLAQYQMESGEDIGEQLIHLKRLAVWAKISITYQAQKTAQERLSTPSSVQ